jgi:hypothetical protein
MRRIVKSSGAEHNGQDVPFRHGALIWKWRMILLSLILAPTLPLSPTATVVTGLLPVASMVELKYTPVEEIEKVRVGCVLLVVVGVSLHMHAAQLPAMTVGRNG